MKFEGAINAGINLKQLNCVFACFINFMFEISFLAKVFQNDLFYKIFKFCYTIGCWRPKNPTFTFLFNHV